MRIDWDEVADDADNSPRGLLADALSHADEIKEVIIIMNFEDGRQQTYSKVETTAMEIAMLELAKWNILKYVHEESEL